jgi:hypothetical protein
MSSERELAPRFNDLVANLKTISFMDKKPIHLLIRFSDSRLKDGDTIQAHNEVIQKEGAVWFGKMGSTVSQNHIDRLNNQVEKRVPTFIFLVKGNRRKSIAYRASLIFASKTLIEKEKHLVPEYYSGLEIPKYVKFWAKLSEIKPIEFSDLQKMRVGSSVIPIGETLAKSSSGHFILREA